MDCSGTGTEKTAKAMEGTWFPLKPRENGISSMTRFKGEIQRTIKIDGVLVYQKRLGIGPG